MAKKKYNPFKMSGSYIGAIVGASSLFWLPNTEVNWSVFATDFMPIITLFLVLGAIGFIIGYFIHLLISRFRK